MIRKILLAEDDRATALLVKTQLEQKGYSVQTAGNGLDALNLLSQSSVDLIITDVVMPKMDGVELYSRIKKNPSLTAIPIIIITDKEIFRESFKFLGVNHFVDKASDINVLLEKIRTISVQPTDIKEFNKVVVCGTNVSVVQEILGIFKDRKCLTSRAVNSAEIIYQSLAMNPQAIIMDVLFQDYASAEETIRSIRCYNMLHSVQIILYTSFTAEELKTNMAAWQSLDGAVKICLEAGANHFIGKFNRTVFIEKLNELNIRSV